VLSLLSNSAFAQEVALSEDYFFQDLPVALSATRLEQPLADLPAAVTIIDRQMIEATGAMSIPDVLRLVPGFTVGFYSGSRATASYHGLVDQYARDMQVLIDGRSIYDPGFGGVSWPDMPIDMDEIKRIEVIRGPNATAYGSNSYSGVINIITEHPADSYGSKIITTFGESGKKRLYGRHTDHIDDFSYRISASYDEGDGFETREDSYDTKWINFRSEKKFSESDQLQVTFGTSEGTYEEGFSDIFLQVRELDNQYNYQQLSWLHEESEENQFQLQFYHNHQKIDDAYESPRLSELILSLEDLQAIPEPFRLDFFAMQFGASSYSDFLNALDINDGRFLISWFGLESHRYDLEFEQTLVPTDKFRFAWGIGFRRDEAKSVQTFHQYESIVRDQARIFGNGELQASDSFVFNVGGMLEDFQGEPPLFSYRGAVNYHFDKRNTIRFNSSRAYRMPTLVEEYIDFVIFMDDPLNDINTWTKTQQDLDPQVINSLELGWQSNLDDLGLLFDIRLFRECYRNIIAHTRDFDYPDPDRGLSDTTVLDNFNQFLHPGAFNYINDGKADIKGIELEAKYQPSYRNLISFGYSYMEIKGEQLLRTENGENVYTDDVKKRAPRHTLSLLGSHLFDSGVQLSAAYYYTDKMTWYGEGDDIPEYKRVDLRASKNIKLNPIEADVSLLVQNINSDSYDFYNNSTYSNLWQTTAYLQLDIQF
jgi:iron complex outermembrane receptor protein